VIGEVNREFAAQGPPTVPASGVSLDLDTRINKHVRFGSIHPLDRSFVANGPSCAGMHMQFISFFVCFV